MTGEDEMASGYLSRHGEYYFVSGCREGERRNYLIFSKSDRTGTLYYVQDGSVRLLTDVSLTPGNERAYLETNGGQYTHDLARKLYDDLILRKFIFMREPTLESIYAIESLENCR